MSDFDRELAQQEAEIADLTSRAEARGREAAEAAIVAWLREQASQMKAAACVAQDRRLPHEKIADQIEAGDHLKDRRG